MESQERLAVRRGMNHLKPYLAAYVAQHSGAIARTDMAALLRTVLTDWQEVYSRDLSRAVRSYIHELIDIRNRWAHEEEFTPRDVKRALDTIDQVSVAIGAPAMTTDKTSASFGTKRSQRTVMREVYARFRGNEDRIVREYAARERNGDVQRIGTKSGLTAEQYALALLNDGIRKGWLR